jgi:hypothetical protein
MSRTGPRGPHWDYYGEGTITLHLTSGQSIAVKVATFKHRYHPVEGEQYEWTPDGVDTLPVIPATNLIAAIEHHAPPAEPAQPNLEGRP